MTILAILVSPVEKCSPTSTTSFATRNTRAALTTETGSSPAKFVTAHLIRETAYVFTSFMCTITTDLTNARCARKLFPSHLASTNTYECTAVTDRTSVLTASKASRPPLFCALTFVSIAEKSRLNVDIAGALSPHTRHMIVTCDAITVRQTSFVNLLYNCVVRTSKHSVSLISKAQKKIGKNRNCN